MCIFVVGLSTGACASPRLSGVTVNQTRSVEAFTEISVSHDVQLEVKKGPLAVTMEGDEALLPLYSTEVSGGRLTIRRKENTWRSGGGRIIARVSVPSLKRLDLSGGVRARVDGAVAEPQFSLEASGGVELEATHLSVQSLVVDASGGTELALSGTAQEVSFEFSGGTDIDARQLVAQAVKLDGSGGGELAVTAQESVVGEASGGSAVQVFGNPPKSRVHTSGGASVRYRD